MGSKKEKTSEHWALARSIAIIITCISATISLFFIAKSIDAQTEATKIQATATKSQVWQNLTMPGREISKILIDNPQLKPYFYDAKPINKNDKNYTKSLLIAELYIDYIESFFDDYVYDLPKMDEGGEYRKMWEDYFMNVFLASPIMKQYLKENSQYYDKRMAKYLK